MSTPIEITAAGHRLAGRIVEPTTTARALVLALHGGTYSSRYYDLQSSPRASALQNYADLGFAAVALDRPGYGIAANVEPAACGFGAQSEILRDALREVRRTRTDDLRVFLIGHSIGGMIALTMAADMAADGADTPLRGVMASGMGMVWQPGLREMWGSLLGESTTVSVPNEARDQVMFAADPGLVDPAVQRDAGADLHPLPAEELRGAIDWTEAMPGVAARISVPVLHVLPEHDGIWASDEHAQRQAAAAFEKVDGATVTVQRAAGHSLDAHRAGYAHHLATAAFFETCLVTDQP
ncbi:alpha/beta hydrolase [Actinomycetospora chibensis]|uniref:Alpha/beta hydrolase n=1 Tax=Actinomycetospora chibensis TaxID=663606 RepID=A0ABV9RND0_9PSEU|nr:alpha/beta fold hydrolase [Actinomycetospora chibensis]MDD7922717.1 alpha/beta fold hydrolase [Actinomycetospora chibensis]